MRSYLMTLALAFPMVAMAQTTVKTETTKETKSSPAGTDTTVETKKTVDPGGMANSKTDEHKSETKVEKNKDGTTTATTEHTDKHDAPGVKNDKKHTSKTKVTKDANGNVISSEHTSK